MDNNKDLTTKWPTIKEKIKEEFPQLTEEDLVCEMGKEHELLLQLREKLEKNKKQIDNWLSIMG